MARFIAIKIEYPDPDDETGDAPLKEKIIYFSPLKVKYLKEFKEVLGELERKNNEDEKQIKENPDFIPDRFDGLKEVGDFLFKLVKIKHKKMTREEFEFDISVSDYKDLMSRLASDVDVDT